MQKWGVFLNMSHNPEAIKDFFREIQLHFKIKRHGKHYKIAINVIKGFFFSYVKSFYESTKRPSTH